MNSRAPRRSLLGRALAAAAVGLVATLAAPSVPAAWAQAYPTKTIRIVVPTSPGGITDLLARLTAEHLDRAFGQRAVIDNRPGAGGNLGVEILAKAAPDGYTLGFVSAGNVVINPALVKNLPFEALDLVGVAPVGNSSQLIVVSGKLPVSNLKELIALAKREPGAINFGSAGQGSTMHLAGDLFARMAGVELVHVPYRGAAPAVADVAAGHVQLIFVGLGAIEPLLAAGAVKALAAGQLTRLTALPDLPTADEAGLPGYEFSTWYGLMAPRGTPAEIVNALNRRVNEMLADPEMQKRLVGSGMEPMHDSPAEFAARLRRDNARYLEMIQAAGLKPE